MIYNRECTKITYKIRLAEFISAAKRLKKIWLISGLATFFSSDFRRRPKIRRIFGGLGV